jgi:hypothetical protein
MNNRKNYEHNNKNYELEDDVEMSRTEMWQVGRGRDKAVLLLQNFLKTSNIVIAFLAVTARRFFEAMVRHLVKPLRQL